jgi:rare lipoprotein A
MPTSIQFTAVLRFNADVELCFRFGLNMAFAYMTKDDNAAFYRSPVEMPLTKNITSLAGLLGGIGLLMLASCATTPAPTTESGGAEVGIASYYADRFHGRQTASGERYDRNAYTAAHRRLPFGTKVQVTRLDTGSSVEVRINDRGPFVKGRVIDLSYAAAKKLGMLRRGVVRVRVVLPD